MDSDRVTKKLALFYHPLFQNTIIEWILSFNVNQTLMDMVTFMEINLRIQKIILPEFTFSSSLPSAATDWVREIETLTPGIAATNPVKDKDRVKLYTDIHKLIHEMIQMIPFDLANSPDKYVEFLMKTSQKNACNYVADKISFSAFAKFLFDLCCSWCEYLDIEIFLFFLLGVLYQATIFQSSDLLSPRPFEQICYLPENFILKVKWLKAQYKKKEYDNFSFEDWYSFNYEPSRLQEARHKIMESLSIIFKHESIPSHLEGLFESSISQILKDGLSKPTKNHFEFLNRDNNEMNDDSNPIFPLRPSTAEKTKKNNQICKNTYTQMPKKTTIPIFGKALLKTQPEPSMRIHTILSINAFKDENDETHASTVPGESPLCPIWEQEVSESGSQKSFRNIESPESPDKSWVESDNKGSPNIQNGITLEPSYGSLLYSSKRFGSIREPKKMLNTLENFYIQEYQNNKDKVYQNRKELIAKSFQQNDQLGDEESFRIDNKISMILEDETKQKPEDKLLSQAHRKKILANASLFDDLMADMHKDTKPLNTRNTNNFRTTVESRRENSSFVRANNSSEGIRGSSQGNRRWKPYSAYEEDIDQNESSSHVKELNDTKKSIADHTIDKGKKNNQLHLPQLGQKAAKAKIKAQGYSQSLAQGYAVPLLKNKKPVLELKGKGERKSNSVSKGETKKNKNIQAGRWITPQIMLDQWYGVIFDKMRQRHEDNRKHQEIRMKILKRPEDNQRGKAAEGKYNTKIGGPVEDRLVDELLKESAR